MDRKKKPEFSILVVCLNPGEKLKHTLDSIKKQTFQNYEVIVKDGLSEDGSLSYAGKLAEDFEKRGTGQSVRIAEQKDTGIYDAMNQAEALAEGKYLYFLNCGDFFYDETVLQKMYDFIEETGDKQGIYYGNIFERETGQVVASNPRMDAFGCYRNVPCHQACFYAKELLEAHPFVTKYRVRADYEQFLWCFFEGKAGIHFKDMLIADYEGGGFSETRANKKISAKEHKEIVHQYMSCGQIFRYRTVMWMTLAPLRTMLAENEKTAGIYNRMKKMLYGKR